jgi:tRNA(Arg) A34 adenosine deaminase TadA
MVESAAVAFSLWTRPPFAIIPAEVFIMASSGKMSFPQLVVRLPDWVEECLSARGGARNPDRIYPTPEDRMRLVIELSRLNVEHETGGPFGAGVFDAAGRLVAPGVNLVTSGNSSILHAEMVAIALAQQALGRFDIGLGGARPHELVASTEPCAMCFGAVPWSGVTRLVCGARGEDACAIGFDEGPKLPDWWRALENRGIAVARDVLRDEAAEVLRGYARGGGIIYNSGVPRG